MKATEIHRRFRSAVNIKAPLSPLHFYDFHPFAVFLWGPKWGGKQRTHNAQRNSPCNSTPNHKSPKYALPHSSRSNSTAITVPGSQVVTCASVNTILHFVKACLVLTDALPTVHVTTVCLRATGKATCSLFSSTCSGFHNGP
jgi:hypothetical protein